MESRISYIPISTQVRNINPFKVQQTTTKLQDYDTVELDDWTILKKENLFTLKEQKTLPYERADNVWVSITVEMDLNTMEFSRHRYTVFDLLADVGGLSGMFASIFAFFMAIWNFNMLDDYFVTKLFTMQHDVDKKSETATHQQQ